MYIDILKGELIAKHFLFVSLNNASTQRWCSVWILDIFLGHSSGHSICIMQHGCVHVVKTASIYACPITHYFQVYEFMNAGMCI